MLKEIFLFRYRPELHQLPPPRAKKSGQKNVEWTKDNIDLVQHKPTGRLMTKTEVDNIPEWEWAEKDKDYGQRSTELLDNDRVLLEDKGLDELKARQIKPLWANGLSIKETTAHFRGAKGFGRSTIAKYYGVFSTTIGG